MKRTLLDRSVVPALTAALLLQSRAASAQSIAWATPANPIFGRSYSSRPHDASGVWQWVSYDDCVHGDVLTFSVVPSGLSSAATVEVWATAMADAAPAAGSGGSGGSETSPTSDADCLSPGSRAPGTATCWQVSPTYTPPATSFQINVAAADLVGHHDTPFGHPPNTATAADCAAPALQANQTIPVTVWLHVLLFDNTNAGGPTAALSFKTEIDVKGPGLTDVNDLGPGDGIVKVDWTQSSESDIAGYNLYCDPPRGEKETLALAGGAGALLSCTDTATSGAAGTASAVAPADASGAAGAAGGAGAAGVGGTGGQSTATCAGPVDEACEGKPVFLRGHAPPDEDFLCQVVSGATTTSAVVDGLSDGSLTHVSIAAFDQLGNVGPLSNERCAIPAPIDDFYKVYRRDGGDAGGGYCGIGRAVGLGRVGFGLALVVASFGALRRRGVRPHDRA